MPNLHNRYKSVERKISQKNLVKQTSSQEPLDGLEPYLAEMFLARSLSSVVSFCSDRPPFKMAAVTKNLRRRVKCDLLSKYV
jgi:hypothetical protein